jgi:cytochrome c553
VKGLTMNRVSKLLAACALTITALSAQAADLEAGQKIADAQCAACHGKDGKTPIDPSYPKLAGQYPDYLAVALRAYQSGERKNPIMAGLAKPLSRQDIDNLAAYFGSLPGPLTHKR